MNKALIFGAGNIGRSFIGSIFSKNGMEVTFIDANPDLVKELNHRGSYSIMIKRNGQADEKIEIRNIRAVHSSDIPEIVRLLGECSLCATSVGQGALPKVLPVIAQGIKARETGGKPSLDIIIAENMRNGADFFRRVFREQGLTGEEPGLVETSIGKMVPIMGKADLASDPLVLFAEEYNSLILDKRGFKGPVPRFPEIKAVENIAAWVDRKLFIHNLGHAAAAYLGFRLYPEKTLLAQVLEDETLVSQVRAAMNESSAALLAEYPDEFTRDSLDAHMEDLLFRFRNQALGDTVFRVGRDLGRKLNRDDRILGAALLCQRHSLPFGNIGRGFTAALDFRAADQSGRAFEPDRVFIESFRKQDPFQALTSLCGLSPESDSEFISAMVGILQPE